MNGRATLYETITNDLITELAKGVAPWVPPWDNGGGTLSLLPWNAASGHRYQGINPLLLMLAAWAKGYRHPG